MLKFKHMAAQRYGAQMQSHVLTMLCYTGAQRLYVVTQFAAPLALNALHCACAYVLICPTQCQVFPCKLLYTYVIYGFRVQLAATYLDSRHRE